MSPREAARASAAMNTPPASPESPAAHPLIRLISERQDGELPAWVRPLENPRWLGAGEATEMRSDDAVVGLEFEGGAWALPWWIMKNHHVANLELNGKPLLVTLCEVCSSAAAFDPVIEGR